LKNVSFLQMQCLIFKSLKKNNNFEVDKKLKCFFYETNAILNIKQRSPWMKSMSRSKQQNILLLFILPGLTKNKGFYECCKNAVFCTFLSFKQFWTFFISITQEWQYHKLVSAPCTNNIRPLSNHNMYSITVF